MQNDHDLRDRFRALSTEEAESAPALSSAHLNAWRSTLLMRSRQTWRFGTVVGVAAGAVAMLTIGLVLGASTGYASAEEIVKERGDTPLPAAPPLAVLKNIPPLIFSCADPVRAAALPPAQQGVPIINLPEPTAKTSGTFGGVLGLKLLSNGSILVNDAGRLQVKVFDSTLAQERVLRDSVPGSATSYGPRRLPMTPYLGDSVLFSDYQGGTILVMGPSGQARAMAAAHPGMIVGLGAPGYRGVDDKGRIVFSTGINQGPRNLTTANFPDSGAIVRVDLDTRRADTLARLKQTGSLHMMGREGDGPVRYSVEPNPLLDEWALLSDGSIAVVRGQDYHIDWIHADGSTHSTGKLPFDWKRLTDAEKQHLIDSTRDKHNPLLSQALGRRRPPLPPDAEPPRPGGRAGGGGAPVEQGPPMLVQYVAPALTEIFDFYPPIRFGALMPDLEGNLWILPTSSAQSKAGELVYDVVNVKGDFHRVRVPVGRSIAGFGKEGVVFLLSGDRTTGFSLEKTKLPRQR
jgi:hypothetical protein